MFTKARSIWPIIFRSLRSSNIKSTTSISFRPFFSHHVKPMCQRSLTTAIAKDRFINETAFLDANGKPAEELNPDELIDKQEFENHWADFMKKIETNCIFNSSDFVNYGANTVKNPYISRKEKIKRLQYLLLQINERIEKQPYLEPAFLRSCNMLIHTYCLHNDLKSARLVLEGLIDSGRSMSIVTVNTIVNGISRVGNVAGLYDFVKSLDSRDLVPQDVKFYVQLIYAFMRFNDVRACRYYYSHMIKNGVKANEAVYKVMMQVNRLAEEPDGIFYFYSEMIKQGFEPDLSIYGIAISGLKSNKTLLSRVYADLEKSGLEITATIYLDTKRNPIDVLRELKGRTHKMRSRDYNTLLAHCVKQNKFEDALTIFEDMKSSQIEPDSFSYGIILDAFAKDPEQPPEAVFELYEEMKKEDIPLDPIVYTSLILACNKHGDLDKALSFLHEMDTYGIKPNMFTFNALFGLLSAMPSTAHINLDKAHVLWDKMLGLEIQPDVRTHNVYLSILARLATPADITQERHPEMFNSSTSSSLWTDAEEERNVPRPVKEMLQLYRNMRKSQRRNVQPDFLTYSIIINALSIAGQMRSAMQTYDDAKMARIVLPVTSYNELIRGFQRMGKMSESMTIWYDMKIAGVLPDSTTYELVLENCEELGLEDALTSIRTQRRGDFSRLEELEKKKMARESKRTRQPRY